MKYTSVRNAKYQDAEKSQIWCEVKFESFKEFVPFLCNKNDSEPHGRKIWAELINGKYGKIEPFEFDPRKELLKAKFFASSRIRSTQWLVDRHRDQCEMGFGTSLDSQQYAQLQCYRNNLRLNPVAEMNKNGAPAWLEKLMKGEK